MIGQTLKELRKINGLKQKDIADYLNVKQQIVSLWEKNLRDPDLGTLVKIAKFFEVTTDYLLGIEE